MVAGAGGGAEVYVVRDVGVGGVYVCGFLSMFGMSCWGVEDLLDSMSF